MLVEIIKAKYPDYEFIIKDSTSMLIEDNLTWCKEAPPELPTQEEIDALIQEALQEKEKNAYRELRAAAYPPIEDFLDAKVKQTSSDPVVAGEGLRQEQNYYKECLAVKERYQK